MGRVKLDKNGTTIARHMNEKQRRKMREYIIKDLLKYSRTIGVITQKEYAAKLIDKYPQLGRIPVLPNERIRLVEKFIGDTLSNDRLAKDDIGTDEAADSKLYKTKVNVEYVDAFGRERKRTEVLLGTIAAMIAGNYTAEFGSENIVATQNIGIEMTKKSTNTKTELNRAENKLKDGGEVKQWVTKDKDGDDTT